MKFCKVIITVVVFLVMHTMMAQHTVNPGILKEGRKISSMLGGIDSASMHRFAELCLRENEPGYFADVYDTAVIYSGLWIEHPADIPLLLRMDSLVHQQSSPDLETEYIFHHYLSDLYILYKMDSVNALYHSNRTIETAKKMGDDCRLIQAYIIRSLIYSVISNDVLTAGIILNDADKAARKMGYENFCKCDSPYELDYSALYSKLEDYEKAIYYINKGIKRFIDKTENGTKSQNGRLYYSYYNRSIYKTKIAEYRSAMADIDSAQLYAKTAPNPEPLFNSLNSLRFIVWYKEGKLVQADSIAKLINYRQLDIMAEASVDYMYYLARFKINMKLPDEAASVIHDFDAMHHQGNLRFRVYLSELNYLLEKARGNNTRAILFAEQFIMLKDSLNSAILKKASISEQIHYETSIKEQEIIIKNEQLSNARKNIRIAIALACTVLLFLLLIIAYRNIRNVKERARLIQQFSKQLIDTREQEQNRLANEMHDGIAQELMFISNSLSVNQDLKHAGMVKTTIDNVRSISRNLYPALLETVGLKKAVEQLLQQIDEQYDIFIDHSIEYYEPSDKYVELQLYRIIQESVNNILKYANAKAMKVMLVKKHQSIQLEISDNGEGFDLQKILKSGNGIGLMTMQQRAQSLKSTLHIKSRPGNGTSISLNMKYV